MSWLALQDEEKPVRYDGREPATAPVRPEEPAQAQPQSYSAFDAIGQRNELVRVRISQMMERLDDLKSLQADFSQILEPLASVADELPQAGEYKVGSLAMANSGANTNGSQFFVITGDQGVALPPQYSLFGQVIEGLDVVQKLDAVGSADGSGKTSTPVNITKVTVEEVAGSPTDSTTATSTGDTADVPTASTTADSATPTTKG